MDSATLAVVLANLAFVLICGYIGVRLLRIASHTRGLPEACIGAGLVGLVLAIPLMGFAGIGRVSVGELNLPLLGFALLVLTTGLGCVFAFTWKAFRPDARWAAVIVGLAVAAESGIAIALVVVLMGAPSEQSSLEAAGPWLLAIRGPLTLNFLWTTFEAFRAYGMARRRLALGLGDPVVANRFLLWAWAGFFSFSNGVVGAALQAQGMGPTNDPRAALVMAVGGVGAAALIWLVFVPPAAYVSWIARRSGRSEAAA